MDGGEVDGTCCRGGILKGIPFLRPCYSSIRVTRINGIAIPARDPFLRAQQSETGDLPGIRIKTVSHTASPRPLSLPC